MSIAALSTVPKIWKHPKCPSTDEWIKKRWYTHIYTYTYTYIHTHTHIYISMMEYYSAIKKNEIFLFATIWMELESIMLSERSQSEKQIPYDFTHV